VALNTWHELRVHAVASTGTVQVWYDGTKVADLTGRPIGASYQSVHLGAEHVAQQGDLAADDVVINQVP
jgi:hypothetical protein